MVDHWPAGCGFTFSASAVSKFWHMAPRPMVGGEMLSLMKCPLWQMNEGGDRRFGVGIEVILGHL